MDTLCRLLEGLRDSRGRTSAKGIGVAPTLRPLEATANPWRRALAAVATLAFLHPVVVTAQAREEQRFPEVVRASVKAASGGRFDFDVTVSSPYDTAARYADAFRVTGAGGIVYGERELLHDHAGEQPFTRDLHGVAIPAGVRSVVVQARDSKNGYGGKTVQVALPGR